MLDQDGKALAGGLAPFSARMAPPAPVLSKITPYHGLWGRGVDQQTIGEDCLGVSTKCVPGLLAASHSESSVDKRNQITIEGSV